MAAKNRRTKGKNWKDSSNDDTSDDDDDQSFTSKKLQNVSFVKREKEREMKRTRKVLNELCDSEDESDTEQTGSRPISSLPITITKKYSKPSVSSGSDSSDSNLNRSAGRHSKISKVSVTSKKQINKNKNSSSESDVEYKGTASGRKRKLDSEEKNNIGVSGKIKTNQRNSDTSSNKEFQKPKAKKRKKSWTRLSKGYIQDDYSVISTPSKSDDENIRVEMKQEISLKHHIFEEIEKIKNVMADLISDLDIQSNYLLKKKVNVLSDSKFIAHKILRIYDGTYEKIKENKNNFAEMYKSWIDTCSNHRSSVYIPSKNLYSSFSDEIQEKPNHTIKEKNQDKRTSKSFEKDRKSDSSDDKFDTSEENKDIQKKHLGLKKKISDDNRLKNSSTSNEDDDSNNLDKTKKSKDSKDKGTSKSFKKDRKSDSSGNKSDTSEENKDIQKKHLGLKKKISDDSRLKNSSTSNEDDDSNNLDKTKQSKDSKTKHASSKDNNSDNSDMIVETNDVQNGNSGSEKKSDIHKNLSTKSSDENENSDNLDNSDENENSDNLDKENGDKQKKIKHNDKQKTLTEGIDNDQNDKHENSSTKSSTEDENYDKLDGGEENDNRQKKNDKSKTEMKTVIDNLSKASTLSASNLQDSIVSNNSVAGEDDILNPEKDDENMLSVSQRVPSVDDDNSQKSLCKEKNLSEPLNENDSMDKVSDCDSDEIFSGDEVRSKRSNKESKTPEEDDSKTEKSKELKKDLKESKDDSCSSNSEVLFETTASEIGNTPVKSPILCSKSRSLRKTLLTTTQLVIDPDLQKSIAFKEDIEPKAFQADSASEDSEREAMKSLLRDSDSDDSTSPVNKENESDADSEISVDSSCSNDNIDKKKEASKKPLPRKSNNLLKKKKKLIIQTKNENSISSDSSSNSGEESNRKKKSSSLEHSAKLTSSRRRQQAFNVQKNRHYKADKKLRMTCRVTLERLSESVLEKYSRALEKSKKNVANKKFNSITNLDGLETKRKSRKTLDAEKSSPSDSTETSSTKAKKKKSVKNNLDEKNESVSELDSTEELDKSVEKKISDNVPIEQEIVKEYENKAKEALLNSLSSSSNENEEAMGVDESNCKKSMKSKAKNGKKNNSDEEASDVKSEDDKVSSSEENDEKKEKAKWKNDELLTFQITDTESEKEKFNKSQEKRKLKEENDKNLDEEVLSNNEKTPVKAKKKRPQRKMRRILDSDSDAVIDSSNDKSVVSVDTSDSEEEKEEKKEEKKKKRGRKRQKSSDSDSSSSDKKQKSKRKRIKKVASESDSDDQDSPGKGRKNIRKVLKDKHVADDTKKAAQDEEHRLKRIAERQRLFNEMYDARLAGEAKVDKLVLDFDEETKKELVVVDKHLVKRLKPHQAQGIKFMWDACFESLKQIKESEGSGCIIAHCMGLGKTFQVVTLTHTLLTHEETGVKTVMVVCPLSTVLNWVNEFKIWLKHVKNGDDIEIYELTKMKKNFERKYQLQSWQRTGGVLIIGYEMYRNLVSTGKKMRKAMQESIMRSLVDPGADLVVCDEGHLLKNEESALSKAMKLVKTMRRIVLTGTPLQNNLKEYHCMVQFVKPNLLGTKKEFLNRFVNPITNGQFEDSTTNDVKLMKKRAHVLHKMLEGSVQRFDYSVLMPFLPPKQEYVIFVRLTEVQIKMYQYYLDNFARRFGQRNGSLFADFQELQRIWTHPYVLRLNAEKVEKANEKKRLEASDSEGSLKDFIDDDSESETSLSSSPESDNSDIQCIDSDGKKPMAKITRSTRLNPKEEPEDVVPTTEESAEEAAWWSKFVEEKHFEDLRISTKLILLFGIVKESEQIGDKVLVFSQSLYSLTLIEQFLNLIDQETQNGEEAEHLDKHSGTWSLGLDYFRLDGSTSAENRSAWCKIFNNPTNTRARLFLISTRAGGLGINLTAANRVIIFDASWNPSHDVQSIFRIYRFGQKKPCYVYRFLAAGTMEEKIYNRQVTKLSLSCRVVDEQQIERHFSNNDLAELYQFESYEDKSTVLALPKDRLLAEIFLKYKDAVYTYHEHDSLLENKQEEELDEEERKQAWQEYEDEKQGKRQMVNMGNNMMLNPLPNSFPELESIKLLIQKDYPNLPPEHLEQVARQAVFDMYRFVDQQAVNQTLNPFGLGQQMHAANMLVPPAMQQQQQFNPQSQLLNMLSQPQMNYPAVNHMPVYSGRGRPPKHMSMNNPMTNMIPVQQPMQFQQTPMQAMNKNDEVEIITEGEATPPHVDIASNSNNIQEE